MISKDTVVCLPHALPFAILIEELRERCTDAEFVTTCRASIPNGVALETADAAKQALDQLIAASDEAYGQLAAAREDLVVAGGLRYADPSMREAAISAAYAHAQGAEASCCSLDAPLLAFLHASQSSALCLSGGGIRSASFCLGVIQALAHFTSWNKAPTEQRTGVMHRLTYLSTVSGGGYVGSWLMAWAQRSSLNEVIKQLAFPASTSADREAGPLRHLREYTSYLAPRPGFTADSATLLAIVLRNLTLNWLIFLPAFMLVVAFPWMESWVSRELVTRLLAWAETSPSLGADEVLMWASTFMLCVSGCIVASRFWHKPDTRKHPRSLRLSTLYFPCICLSAWLAVQAWTAGVCTLDKAAEVFNTYSKFQHEYFLHIFYALLFTISPLWMDRIYALWGSSQPMNATVRTGLRLKLLSSVFTSAAATFATAALIEVSMVQAARHLPGWNPAAAYSLGNIPCVYNVIAFPVALLLLMVGSTLLSGLTSAVEREEEREWWGRSGGVLFLIMAAWIVLQSCAWYGPAFLHHLGPRGWRAYSLPLLGVTTGGAASLAASSAGSSSGLRTVKLDELGWAARLIAKYPSITPVLGAVAIALLIMSVASVDGLLARDVSFLSFGPPNTLPGRWTRPLLCLAVLLVSLLTNFCINVNTFSLHSMYRMRLVRAFLGASNFARAADPVTNFDPKDDVPFASMSPSADLEPDKSSQAKPQKLPIHLVCATLNLVGTRELAWRQRKAEPFSFSRLHCGSWRLGYAATSRYGDDQGLSLGTAMAISGAAISPNMGYNSSPTLSFLMTLFNLRLGWWLPNPVWPERRCWKNEAKSLRFLRRKGPDFALFSMIAEALGRTDDSGKWLQLSDGGHFENLGLYEMVLRRCHRIIVVDADADRGLRMEDLGNALRKIRIDLGISIQFEDGLGIGLSRAALSTGSDRFCAVGTIRYSSADGPHAPDGELLFLKARKIDDEPVDVASYAASHASFPHETTANQFFTEAQFESYRALGFTLVQKITRDAEPGGRHDMDELFESAERVCGHSGGASPFTGL